ncbi:hypothetical protein LWC33_13110 [Pseudonocardia sp. RS11V-5]|uniref:hypothetical protein n=1 Tax=Pseudonocardia terrae TaxID=2905831 RepID=UPI001E2B9608|nr:hypothetical protein [Pseudonocardia terrae]MCE3552397.1 hypothetical protein [Pseudonocardia terrae]
MAVVVVRLLPQKPVEGDDFMPYLEGLEISIADRSFEDPSGMDAGHQLGSAAYLTEGDPDATIVQHLRPPLLADRAPVATAAIEIPDPLPFPEYQTVDLAFVITRTVGANPPQTVQVKEFHFNVDTSTNALPNPGDNTPIAYAGLEPVAAYLYLPKPLVGLAPGSAYVATPTDGSAPPYAAVRTAMETVLAQDPGAGAPSLADLTPAQCRHLAWEIVSNHALDPLPVPTRDLETLYRGGDETARQQFEADLVTYYATQATNADVIATFAYSVSAAIACQQHTQAATRVGLTIPVLPGLPSPATLPVVVSQ